MYDFGSPSPPPAPKKKKLNINFNWKILLMSVGIIGLVGAVWMTLRQPSQFPLHTSTPVNSFSVNMTAVARSQSNSNNVQPTSTALLATALPTILSSPPMVDNTFCDNRSSNTEGFPDPLSAEDRQYFDRVNENTTSASSYQFNLNSNLSLNDGQQGTASLNLTGTINDIMNGMSIQIVARMEMNENGRIQSGQSEMRLVGENIYLQVPAQMSDGTSTMQWVGFNLDQAFDQAMNESGMTDQINTTLSSLQDLPQEVLDLITFGRFVTTRRLSDNDQRQAVFSSQIHMVDYLQSQDFVNLMRLLSEFMSNTDTATEEIVQNTCLFQQQQPFVMPVLTIATEHYVNLDRDLVDSVYFDVDVIFLSADSAGNAIENHIELDGDLTLTGIGSNFAISEPTNYIIIDPASLGGMSFEN